ncbi:uncharacterized protein LOC141817966, partial [Curcuma longa]|uniref:uncharacterized protein LOC141817966 n=1 Tax=Curcuma longa TaxID=136217 RepID=UPI003D9EA2E5
TAMSAQPSDRTVLRVVGGCFTPEGHKVAAYITSKFDERLCPAGHTWRHVDQDMRTFYYDEFLKKYTWEAGHEQEFQATWNAACAKLYKDMLYKARKKGTKPFFIPHEIWDAWQAIWSAEKWQANAVIARSNRNTELAGPSTGSTKHTAGSRSIVEHTLDLEHELQRPPTCWEIFTKTNKSKDGSFIDPHSVAQASAATVQGGEPQVLSPNQVNEIYYDVVGGRKKSSTLYGLGSQARVAYDRVMAPRARGRPSGSSSTIEALQKENEELRTRLSAVEASQAEWHQMAQNWKNYMEAMGSTPPMRHIGNMEDAETQDPDAPDQ